MEIELTSDKVDLDWPTAVQDQTVIYQLRRSCNKIEQLMQDVNRLRNDTVTQCKIIASLQEQLRQTGSERGDMEDCILGLRAEVEGCHRQLAMMNNNVEKHQLEKALGILKKRYKNCQEENVFLRLQIKEKDGQMQTLKTNNQTLNDGWMKQKQEINDLQLDLQSSAFVINDLRRFNAELQLLRHQLQTNRLDSLAAMIEERRTLKMVDVERRDAQRGEEGWFCEFKDLKDTVEHIQQLRDEARMRKTAKIES